MFCSQKIIGVKSEQHKHSIYSWISLHSFLSAGHLSKPKIAKQDILLCVCVYVCDDVLGLSSHSDLISLNELRAHRSMLHTVWKSVLAFNTQHRATLNKLWRSAAYVVGQCTQVQVHSTPIWVTSFSTQQWIRPFVGSNNAFCSVMNAFY